MSNHAGVLRPRRLRCQLTAPKRESTGWLPRGNGGRCRPPWSDGPAEGTAREGRHRARPEARCPLPDAGPGSRLQHAATGGRPDRDDPADLRSAAFDRDSREVIVERFQVPIERYRTERVGLRRAAGGRVRGGSCRGATSSSARGDRGEGDDARDPTPSVELKEVNPSQRTALTPELRRPGDQNPTVMLPEGLSMASQLREGLANLGDRFQLRGSSRVLTVRTRHASPWRRGGPHHAPTQGGVVDVP